VVGLNTAKNATSTFAGIVAMFSKLFLKITRLDALCAIKNFHFQNKKRERGVESGLAVAFTIMLNLHSVKIVFMGLRLTKLRELF
jgi:hypothetical protein